MTRPLLLSGFMATGKSAVGRALAEKAGCLFVDLDECVVKKAGKSIKTIFANEGEEAFRRIEGEALQEQLRAAKSRATVISLGGGALLNRALRLLALNEAIVLTLCADPKEIVRRAFAQDGDSGSRPLLAGDSPEGKIRRLLDERAIAYAESHGQVNTDGRSIDDIVTEVRELWARDMVAVAAGADSYCVQIGSGLIEKHLASYVGSPSGTLLVTDSNVDPLHGDKARKGLLNVCENQVQAVLTPGEEHKNLASLSAIFETAFEAGMDRSSTFVGLGGGVVTDMTGFAAATWVRGVRWVGLPTTLLSMVDASVGGKTAVDFHTAKNSVGAFWQPAGVICDVDTLQTETERAYVGALSEVVKTALVGDAPLLDFLEERADDILKRDPATAQEMVERCVRVKAQVVALDAREGGVRAHLNLGHTIGHALESSGGYTALTHGEAVSLGLVAALRLGERKGHTPQQLTARILSLLKRLGLPHHLDRAHLEKSSALLGHDKKRAGSKIRFVYAQNAGELITESIEISDLISLTGDLADS